MKRREGGGENQGGPRKAVQIAEFRGKESTDWGKESTGRGKESTDRGKESTGREERRRIGERK